MNRQIEFKIGDTSFVADLLETEAPRNCNALWNMLPLESDAHHAKFAGSELFFGFPHKIVDTLENRVYIFDLRPGDIAVSGNTMIICYGPMQHELYPTALIARTAARTRDLEALIDACKRAFKKPGERIIVQRKS